MPRPVPPRQTGGDGSGSTPDWRARWKRWAVEQLPATAPHAMRVEVRAAVERALARVAPTADEGEIRDLVMLVVDEARTRLNADAEREARHARKAVLVACARPLLVTALRKLSSHGALRMIKRPGYSFQRLEYRLTRHLERHLTGEETWSEVQARVEAWVDARLAEQSPARGVSKSALVAGGATGVALGFAAAQHPAARETAARAVQKGRELAQKGREILAKLLTPPPAPPAG